jgi:hypothetical protein
VAGIQKHTELPAERVSSTDSVPRKGCGHESPLSGSHCPPGSLQDDSGRPTGPDQPIKKVILQLVDVPATPANVERIRERVQILNRQLADAGIPVRLRVI